MAKKLEQVLQILTEGVLMKTNEGKIDRILRVLLGLGLLSLVFVGPQSMWGLIGIVPLLTGAIGYCPLYQVFGLNTCPLHSKRM